MKNKSLITKVALEDIHRYLRNTINKKWNRVLPFNEEITDRWEKARYLKFGRRANVYDSSFVFGEVKVGENTWVGPFTILDGTGGLEIGSYCSISAGVQIYTHDSVEWSLSGGKQKYKYASVIIGKSCFIGPNVIIAKGIKIGSHCVIGASSFVNKDIPDNSIAFGLPCRIKGKVVIDKKGQIKFRYADKSYRR